MDDRNMSSSDYTIKNFFPLLIIFLSIVVCTVLKACITKNSSFMDSMQDFMGFFFLIFGFFKVINLSAFAQAYAMYDLIAKRSKIYAFIYPFIELFLGIMYITHNANTFVNICTLILMILNAAGVAQELRKGQSMACACLGNVFKVPMTYITLLEDVLMAVMAFIMVMGK